MVTAQVSAERRLVREALECARQATVRAEERIAPFLFRAGLGIVWADELGEHGLSGQVWVRMVMRHTY